MIETARGSEHVFKALASRVRREILFHLKDGELAAGEIASRFDVAAPTISRRTRLASALKTCSISRSLSSLTSWSST